MTNAAPRGKPDAGNPHVRFDEGEVAPAATPRRGSLLYKRLLVVMMAIAGMAVIAATPTVSNVTAKQRFPWNGLVDIFCTVSGIDGTTNGLKFVVAAVMPDSSDINKVSHFWVVENGTNSASHKVHAAGDYRLLWNAQADLGAVIYSNMVVRVTVDDVHGKVQLWEGGPYWADTNIGAEEPWEYGYYFWWGDTVGYKRENNSWVASDGSSSDFSFEEANTPTNNKWENSLKREGWITADNILAPEHDAAHVQWGGEWRMPTNQELSDLTNMCDFIWTTVNDVKGYIFSGKGAYASASIFLPAAGVAEYRVQRDIYAEPKGFSRRERKGRKAHAAQSTCLRSLTR